MPAVAPTSLSSCSSRVHPSSSPCSNSLASSPSLSLGCGTCWSFCLGCSLPSFPHTGLLCVLRISDLLPLLRDVLLNGDLPQQLFATLLSVSSRALTAVCHDFMISFVCLLIICLPPPVDLSSLKAVTLSVWFIRVSVSSTVLGTQETLDIRVSEGMSTEHGLVLSITTFL